MIVESLFGVKIWFRFVLLRKIESIKNPKLVLQNLMYNYSKESYEICY
jgi:hypothetical protein